MGENSRKGVNPEGVWMFETSKGSRALTSGGRSSPVVCLPQLSKLHTCTAVGTALALYKQNGSREQ